MSEPARLPPKLLRYELLLNDQLPTLARLEIQADDGKHSVLVNRGILESLAKSCLETAARLPRPGDLS